MVGLTKSPAAIIFPEASAVTEVASSYEVPPADFAQRTFPEGSYFTKNISTEPALVKVVEPKVMVGLTKDPAAIIFPEASAVTEVA